MQAMDAIIKRARDLPVLNLEAFRLIQYCSSPQASLMTLEGMLKSNPNLAAQVMRLANSPSMKRFKSCDTLMDALVLLGMDTLRKIFAQNFYGSLGKMLKTQARELEHGRECAVLSEHIAKTAGLDKIECGRIYISGLLHDIGQLFMAFTFPSQFEETKKLGQTEKLKSFQAESKIFGVAHQDVGATICSNWNFPGYLVDSIRTHHREGKDGMSNSTIPVFCANSFLDQRDGTPFQPYEGPLKSFFTARGKPLPWADLKAEFSKVLAAADSR